MGTGEPIEQSQAGLELDKIDLTEILFTPQSGKKEKKSGRLEKPKLLPGQMRNMSTIWIVGGILLSLLVVFLLWGQAIFDSPIGFNPGSKYKRIAVIGPVSTSLGKSDYINFTVKIECKNRALKKRATQLERRLNNKIMQMLDKPENEQRFLARDFDALKPHIKKEVEGLIGLGTVEKIYFSQIRIY